MAALLPSELWDLMLKAFTPPWMWRVCCMVCKLWRSYLWPTITSLEETTHPIPNHGLLFSALIEGGHWTLLHWCNAHGACKDAQACAHALRKGCFDEFKQMLRGGFPADPETTKEIARRGDLHLLQKVNVSHFPHASLSLSLLPPSRPHQHFPIYFLFFLLNPLSSLSFHLPYFFIFLL